MGVDGLRPASRVGGGPSGALGALLILACGTDAVGISECREIERARCTAAEGCGYPAVAECRRYYRDHCLHGVPIEAVNSVALDSCVQEIERAGECALAQGGTTAPSACVEPLRTVSSAASVCDVVRSPELAVACAFLAPGSEATESASPPVVVPTDAGGS